MIESQVAEKKEELGRLVVKAPIQGYVVPAPVRASNKSHDGRLPLWAGYPYDPRNQGAFVVERDQLFQIGDPTQVEAVLVIDQADIDLLSQSRGRTGRWPDVELKLDAYRWTTLSGQIESVASAPMEVSPMSLASQGGGELNTKADATGVFRPISTSYQARVRLAGV
jgi:putative peptide zinc metalloprotease protein